MTAPDHLRITGPEDILGFIPHSLGYWPENSLVAMTLQGKRLGATLRVDLPAPDGGGREPSAGRGGGGAKRRSGSHGKDVLAGFARNVASYLEADDAADGSLLAFFTDIDTDTDATSDGDGTAWAGLLKELELALDAAGMPLRDAWIIGAEFWRNAYCRDPECCEPPGRPIEQIRNSRLNAEMVFRGSSVGAAPGAHETKPTPLPVNPALRAAESGWAAKFSPRRRDRAQFAQVLDVWMMVMQLAVPNSGSGDSSAADFKTPDAGSVDPKAMGWPLELPPELTGYLRASLCIPSWRDAVLVMAAAGRRAAERGAEDFGMFDAEAAADSLPGTIPDPRPGPTPSPMARPTSGLAAGSAVGTAAGSAPGLATGTAFVRPRTLPDAPADTQTAAGGVPGTDAVPGYGEVLLGLAPSVPDWALMVGLERVLKLLGSLGDGEPTAAGVTARGWIEWCRGRGSYADALYQQALRDQPGYRLAELLAELGRRGTLCGWAARREAAWQKFAPDAA